jgi:hypothetical protein
LEEMPVTVVTVVTLDTGIFFSILQTRWIAVTEVTASQFQKSILRMKYKNTWGIQNPFQSAEFVIVTPVTLFQFEMT